jgi:hypothetical protein
LKTRAADTPLFFCSGGNSRGRGREGLAPFPWPRPAGRRAGPGGNALGMMAVFSCGGGCNTMARPGFFVPALRVAFYPAGDCGAKKGGV